MNYHESAFDLRIDLKSILCYGIEGFRYMSGPRLEAVWKDLFNHDDIEIDVDVVSQFGSQRLNTLLSEVFYDDPDIYDDKGNCKYNELQLRII